MYYWFENFDPLPDWIRNIALSSDTYQSGNWINFFPDSYTARLVTQKDGATSTTQTFKRYGLGQQVYNWVTHNTFNDIIDCCVCVGESRHQNCGPHRDRNRNFTLLWVLDAGGDAVETCFWHEHGRPVIRNISKEQKHQQPSDYRTLTKLDGIVIPPERWVLIDSRVLHSVENITGKRISFQVSLDRLPDKFN